MKKFSVLLFIMTVLMGFDVCAVKIPETVKIGINASSLATSVELSSSSGVYTDSSFAENPEVPAQYHYIADSVTVTVGEKGSLICNGVDSGESEVDFLRTSDYLTCQKKRYRGVIRLRVKSGKILIVNEIGLEKYLYGVLGREMSEGFPLEALKAQSIAARNYAILNLGRHSADGFDLCNGEHCQAYGGVDSEGEKIKQAVNETTGRLLCLNGEVVNCYYYSSNGGYSENSENVWVATLPHLKGKPDPFEDASRIPGYNWTRTFTSAEIKSHLKAKGINIGDIVDIVAVGVSENKHVTEIVIKGTEGEKRYYKDNIRAAFPQSLKSTLFTVTKTGGSGSSVMVMTGNGLEVRSVGSATVLSGEGLYKITEGGADAEFTFSGSGNGHGVGMSQYGAMFMAEQGYTYKDILKFYFTDTEIVKNES